MNHHLLPLLAAVFLSACGNSSAPDSAAAPPEAADPAIEQVFASRTPETEPAPIPEVRNTRSPGDPVVLEGRVMGVPHPFVEGRAVFILGDNATITPCSDVDGDHCPTPWDACCDPNEIRQAGTATIQIVDGEGAILRQGLKGVGGLRELSTVRVAGSLADASTPEALIVNASAIQVRE